MSKQVKWRKIGWAEVTTFLVLAVCTVAAMGDPAIQASSCDGGQEATLRTTSSASCLCVNRALDALSNHLDAVKKEFKPGISINFNVFYQNPDFYLTRLRSRVNTCGGGQLKFECVGLCHTEQGTLAYVKVIFGHVLPTVNVCDEFFQLGDSTKQDTLTHEMGRLENIGGSPNFDTDNIYVWDAIVQHLCDDATYKRITAELR